MARLREATGVVTSPGYNIFYGSVCAIGGSRGYCQVFGVQI